MCLVPPQHITASFRRIVTICLAFLSSWVAMARASMVAPGAAPVGAMNGAEPGKVPKRAKGSGMKEKKKLPQRPARPAASCRGISSARV